MSLLLFLSGSESEFVSNTTFIEPILDRFVSILQDDMDSAIDLINSEKSDFEIPYVLDDNYDVFDPGLLNVNQFPFIAVYTDPDADGGDQTNYHIENDFNINVKIYVAPIALADNTTLNANKVSNLHRAAYRYIDAITRVIKKDDTLRNYVELCEFNGFEYASPADLEYNNLVYWAECKWTVKQSNFINKEV